MQITNFYKIDPEFDGFLTDFVFSVRAMTQADSCQLYLTNNLLNVIFSSGKISISSPDLIISTKERTHINCHLFLYKPKKWDVHLQFHLKLELEILRKFIEARLRLFFKKEWQNKAFFFEYKPSVLSFETICFNLLDYLNKFIDIEVIGIAYIYSNIENYFSINKHEEIIKYFAKTAFLYLKNQEIGDFSKKYSEYYLIARKVFPQFLCFLFKGEVHPIYLTAINFIIK